MKNNKEKIAANVVTYNRKALLKECLDALLYQTKSLDSIIVIDNASNDGTKEMLKKEYLNNPIFDYVRLEENTGSAGGQYTGIKRAYEKGFDWVWCMDDDGIVEKDALEQLLKYKDKNIVLNSLVIDPKEGLLSFGLKDYKTKKRYSKIKDVENKKIIFAGSVFNATLIPRKIIKEVGYPNKNLFIWGDERDYCARIVRSGFEIKTIINSICYHPKLNAKKLVILNKAWYINAPIWKNYYAIRNTIYILKKYESCKALIFIPALFFIEIFLIIFIEKNKFKRVKCLLKAYYDGLFDKLGKKAVA